MEKAKQRDKILAYCFLHGSITIREAFGLGINSPSKRISELRHSGEFVVEDTTEYVLDEDGKVETKFKRYFIKAVGADG